MILTIAIPTYNRNETLKKSIVHLLPQITPDCQLVIQDNHSDTPVAESVNNICKCYPGVSVKIVRHRWNLGATANILRCLEVCETEWIWILGDDDIVAAGAVDTVLKNVSNNDDSIYFSFLTQAHKDTGARRLSYRSRGRSEFIQMLDCAHLLNFMSCSVWRAEPFRQHISTGFDYAYSMGWTFALLLTTLRDSEVVVFSNEVLVLKSTISPIVNRWSFRRFLLGWPTLLEINLSKTEGRILGRKLLGRMITPETIAAYLLVDQTKYACPDRFLTYDLVKGRIAPYKIHRLSWLRFAIYRLLFIKPELGWSIVRRAIQVANRLGVKSIDLSDMEGRAA
ncbi:MAG: glycosyltransferase family 2 protein [Verrucomicrobia bacterium]|nr:glycosyltransferase family 2 protein [Verrucomicrobiota bacterium]